MTEESGEHAERIRRAAVKLAALSQNGLTFATDNYDLDRYQQIGAVATELLSVISGRTTTDLTMELGTDHGYATPKVDVRGALIDENERILLMRERSDGRWSLPGGWADPLDSPSDAVEREIREETGYGATAVKLVACLDRDQQGHLPKFAFHVYKLFFLCRPTGDVIDAQPLETLEIGWFGLAELPPLSMGRVTPGQLERLIAHHRQPQLPTEFD
jgi:ADP-ribose pyrophosphatase YjhB (NUDIX family)